MKFKSVTKATSEAGTVNPTGASEFTPGCWRGTCLNFSFLCSVLWNVSIIETKVLLPRANMTLSDLWPSCLGNLVLLLQDILNYLACGYFELEHI
jgi:hypothetical protein